MSYNLGLDAVPKNMYVTLLLVTAYVALPLISWEFYRADSPVELIFAYQFKCNFFA